MSLGVFEWRIVLQWHVARRSHKWTIIHGKHTGHSIIALAKGPQKGSRKWFVAEKKYTPGVWKRGFRLMKAGKKMQENS